VALNGNLTVLLPASNVSGHLLEVDFFSQEDIHLSLDWVVFVVANKCRAEINSGHRVEINVGTRVATHDAEVGVEQIVAVTAVGHAIVNDRLKDDFHRGVSVEGKVLTVAGNDLTLLLESVLDGGSVGALVLDETFLASILSVPCCSEGKFVVPVESAHGCLMLQFLNGLVNCCDTLFRSKGSLGGVRHSLPL